MLNILALAGKPGMASATGVKCGGRLSCAVVFLALLLLVTARLAAAESGALPIGANGSYVLTQSLSYLEDPEHRLTFAEVAQTGMASAFRPLASEKPTANFGLTRSAYWLRVTLQRLPEAPTRWLLEVGQPTTDRIELFMPRADGGFDRLLAGDLLPFADRPVAHRSQLFPLVLPAAEPRTLYLRVASEGIMSVPVRLWQADALWQRDLLAYSALSLYFGVLIGLLLYNLLLYLSLRDRLYLIYVAFVATMAIGQAGLTGFGGQFLWPQLTWWANIAPVAGMSATGFFAVLFARGFLSTPSKLPRLDKALITLAALFTLCFLAALLLSYWIAATLLNGVAIVFSVSVVAVGAYSLHEGHPGARFFLLAWTILLLSAGVASLHNLGALPSTPLTVHSLLIGSALEMLLLSFALADRINVSRRDKEAAQAAALLSEQSRVEALRQAERLLETRVAQRTRQLEEANARLKKHEQLLEYQAHHDTLTGLVNRKLLNDRLAMALTRAERSETRFALLVIDLDDFKLINDRHGHAAGDAVLAIVARRLEAAVRASDTTARIGGDEFVLILDAPGSDGDIAEIIEKIARTVAAPIALPSGERGRVGVSIGLAIYPAHGDSPEQLFNHADQAMYRSKAGHHGN
jgi:diguanylate cyclase (GGDEF)-like protein